MDDQARGPSGQREARDEEKVVREDGGAACPQDRRRHHRLYEQVVRVRQRRSLGIEDVGVEQVQRIPHDLMRYPRQRPFVQDRVAGVVPGKRRGRRGQRPGVHHGQQDEEHEARRPQATRVSWPRFGRRRS